MLFEKPSFVIVEAIFERHPLSFSYYGGDESHEMLHWYNKN